MDLNKLPARYSRLEDNSDIESGAAASRHFNPQLHPRQAVNVPRIEGQEELNEASSRPGFLTWKGGAPSLRLSQQTKQPRLNTKNKQLSNYGDETQQAEAEPSQGAMAAGANIKPNMMKKLVCCLACAAAGGLVVYLLSQRGML